MYEGSQIEERKNTVTNKDGKTYCLECGRRTKYYISSAIVSKKAWCMYYTYIRLNARCGICGKDVYVQEIEIANQQAENIAYKNAKGK